MHSLKFPLRLLTFALPVALFVFCSPPARSAPVCAVTAGQASVLVTAECIDPQFSDPVVDSRREVRLPFPHLWVTGHFRQTGTKFNFYFPGKDRWEGRFFQSVYPTGTGDADDDTLMFGLESGAYTVQTSAAGGYRGDAAAAKLAKKMAREYYGAPQVPIYGYVYGGSGGSYQTIGAIENTTGVWDGGVPFVVGGPTSIPHNFFVRAFARLVLKEQAEKIADAVRPGGTGDPYAGLNATQRTMLTEVTSMGVPLRGWDNFAYLLGLDDVDGLMGFRDVVKGMDPTYASDFWTKPGYLGTERSELGDIVRTSRFRQAALVGPVAHDHNGKVTGFIIERLRLPADAFGLDFSLIDDSGKPLGKISGTFAPATNALTLSDSNAAQIVDAIHSGASLSVDNDWTIALTSYHRHQVPPAVAHIDVWNQFLAADGKPLYPQRGVNAGAQISTNVTGGRYTGKVKGKMIIISNALDVDAFPWHGDWYAKLIKDAQGLRDPDNVRLWINDNADHLDGKVIASGKADTSLVRLVNYVGIVQQAVRDLSTWVERNVPPAPSSAYELAGGQVKLNQNPAARNGIQPGVTLKVNGAKKITVRVGDPVTIRGTVHTSAATGALVMAEFSQSGTEHFVQADVSASSTGTWTTSDTISYSVPGTYYPVFRVTTQRDGMPSNPFAKVRNLARARIIAEDASPGEQPSGTMQAPH